MNLILKLVGLKDIFHHVDNTDDGEIILAASHGYCMHFLVKYLFSSTDQFKITGHTDIIFKLSPNTGVIKLALNSSPQDGGLREIRVLAEHDYKHLDSLGKKDVVHTYAQTTRFAGCIHQ